MNLVENFSDIDVFYYFETLRDVCEINNKDYNVYYLEAQKSFLLVGIENMDKTAVFTFNYGDYDNYFQAIYHVNKLITKGGMLEVFANNDLYNLEAGIVVIEPDKNKFSKAKKYLTDAGMVINPELSTEKITDGMFNTRYNVVTLTPNLSIKSVISLLKRSIFLHSSKKDIDDKYERNAVPKIFAVYSQKDKTSVEKIIEYLRDYNIDFWVDEEKIDFRDCTLTRFYNGMVDSKLPIIFISKNTLESKFAKFELGKISRNILYDDNQYKKWLVVKLDDINLNSLMPGISNYKFFELFDVVDISKLNKLAEIVKGRLAD